MWRKFSKIFYLQHDFNILFSGLYMLREKWTRGGRQNILKPYTERPYGRLRFAA
jgi:hypothetical protein